MFFVPGIRANRDPDAGAELLNQLAQEFWIAVVKPLDIDWISDRSMPSPVGRSGLRRHLVLISYSGATGAHRGTKDRPIWHFVPNRLEVTTTAGYH